jgi:hypothetical protein
MLRFGARAEADENERGGRATSLAVQRAKMGKGEEVD